MPQSPDAVTLPSGRVIRMRRCSPADFAVISGQIPDPAALGDAKEAARRGPELLIRMTQLLIRVIEEPRYWGDYRTEELREKEPRDCPADREWFDLDLRDTQFAIEHMLRTSGMLDAAESTRPLPATGST